MYGLTRMVSGDIKGCFRIKQILTKAQDDICKSLHYITQFLKCHPNSLQSLQRADELQKHREYSFLEPSSYTDQYSLIILKLYNFSQANEFVQDLLLRQQLVSWLLQPCLACTRARLSPRYTLAFMEPGRGEPKQESQTPRGSGSCPGCSS